VRPGASIIASVAGVAGSCEVARGLGEALNFNRREACASAGIGYWELKV
jgi:hypothetical protein